MVILRNIFFFFLHSESFLNQQIERKLINTNKSEGKRRKKERMRNIFAENGKFLRYYFETSGYSPSIRPVYR